MQEELDKVRMEVSELHRKNEQLKNEVSKWKKLLLIFILLTIVSVIVAGCFGVSASKSRADAYAVRTEKNQEERERASQGKYFVVTQKTHVYRFDDKKQEYEQAGTLPTFALIQQAESVSGGEFEKIKYENFDEDIYIKYQDLQRFQMESGEKARNEEHFDEKKE